MINPFYKSTGSLLMILMLSLTIFQCQPKSSSSTDSHELKSIKISLAQWSIHRAIESGSLRAEDFAAIAKNDFGIDAIEYVATYYKTYANDKAFWKRMKAKADSLGVRSLLIMVDNEGDLGNPVTEQRNRAVENHFKWVDAANILGCHSIRINAFGEGTKEEVKMAMVDALKQLCAYSQEHNINVLIENHGLYSSDGQWVVDIIKEVNMPNCGTLPDFGNWCTSVKWGSTQGGQCASPYDQYKGTEEMLPYARGVSAKSYAFNEAGEESSIDYNRMLRLVQNSNFEGFIGIEFEGSSISESEGIKSTKALLEKILKQGNAPAK